jgi:hypothetical protein
MRARMERCFGRHPNRTNPWAHALLAGETADAERGPAANALRLAQADAATFLAEARAQSFDAFTLSNILDGAEPQYRRRLAAAIGHAAAPGAIVVSRSFAEPDGVSSTNRAADDRSMLWGVVDVRPAADYCCGR